MALNWFDASAEKKLGASLAQFFIEHSPANAPDICNHFPAQAQDETLLALAERVAQFRLDHKLNIYKKAQFGNTFKWTLKELGYAPAYVDQLTNWLLLRL